MAGPLGATPGIIVGVAVGAAAAAAIEPAIELPRQQAWKDNPNRILDPAILARLVAQGGLDLSTAHEDGLREGYTSDKVDALVYLSQTVPGFAEALALWRRNPGTFDELWSHALIKAGLDARYLPYLNQLKDERLSPPVVALAIVRGLMDAPFPLPFTPPSGVGNVAAFPKSSLDALTEAEAFGFNKERLFVQTAISGRPMGPESAAAAFFKGILLRDDYDRAVLEGDVRGEWGEPILENARPIPHPLDYVQGKLRNWITVPEMHAGAARSGMVKEDADFLELIHGRPPSAHQVFIGLRRGGVYNGPTDMIPAPILKAMQEADLRPEWYNILFHSLETLPAPFVNRTLTQAGDITQEESYKVLHDEGWPLDLATTVSTRWASKAGSATATDPHVAKANTSLFSALHRSYVAREEDAGGVQPGMTALGIPGPAQTAVLQLWDEERNLIHRQNTRTDAKKQMRAQTLTQAEAVAKIVALGYSVADATAYLTE